jgi:1-acyl-sn-glycerol-3-phosphate acyltransferase
MNLIYKAAIIKISFLRKLIGSRILNPERLQNSTNCIIAANHISYLDPPFLGSLFKQEINYLAKAELFKFKPFGKLLSSLNAIPIKRGRIDRSAIKTCKNRLQSGQSLVIFPEGSRSSFKAKPGIGKIAVQTNKDILPIYIANSNKLFACLFRKKRLTFVVGKKLKINDFMEYGDNKQNYRRIANHVLEKINELKNECKNC